MKRSRKSRKNQKPRSKKDAPSFEVEQMERRLLLSANLYDAASGNTAVKDRIESRIVETFEQLGNLGDEINEANQDQLVPLIDETLGDLAGDQFGDFFDFAAWSTRVENFFNTAAPNSAGLAVVLESVMSDFGLSGSVTDLSTANRLDLQFDLASGIVTEQTEIRLGEAEEELNLRIEDGTDIELSRSWDISFSFDADLSSIGLANPFNRLSGLSRDKFSVDFSAVDSYTVDANALHTSTSDVLSEFGVQLGILGMRDSSTPSGAYALSGTDFRLDVSGRFDFSSGLGSDGFDLNELNSFETNQNWSEAYSFVESGTSSVEMTTSVAVDNVATSDNHIGGLDGIAGTFTLRDEVLFDQSAAQVTIDETLASFSRLTSQDILNMAGGVAGWAAALQASNIYDDNVPFLDLSTGDAYAFGEAFQEVFLAQLQDIEQVLTARNAPSTMRSGGADPLDFTGETEFYLSIDGNAWTVVTLTANPARNTLAELVIDLNAVLPPGIAARLTETNSPRLELFSNEDTRFVVSQFDTGSNGKLDLGFDSLQQLAIANDATTAFGGALTTSGQVQFDGIVFDSSSSIDLSNFASATNLLTFQVNGAAAVSMEIPQFDYTDLDVFVTQLNGRLAELDLYDVTTGHGIKIDSYRTSAGLEGIRIIGGADIHSLQLGGNARASLNLSATLQESNYLEFELNGDTTTSYRVYLPGNLTGNLLGSAANSTVADLVNDLKYALANLTYRYDNGALTGKEALLDSAGGTGLDIRGSKNDASNTVSLQIFALNPGAEPGSISSFELTGQTAGLSELGFANTSALPFASGEVVISPNFDTVQEFAARIANSPISLTGDASPSWDTNTLTFNFPVRFDYTADALVDDLTTVDENEAIALDLQEEYGEISAFGSESRVEVERTTTSEFDFQFALRPTTDAGEALEVEVPVLITYWDGVLFDDAIITVVLDDAVEHDLLVTADSTIGNIETADFVLQLHDAIVANSALNGKVSVSLLVDPVDGRETIQFVTDPTQTDSRLLEIRVRPQIDSPVATTNAAVDKLQFTAGKTDFTSVNGALIGTAPPTAFTLNRHSIFEVSLFDGNVGVIFLDAAETSDNTSLADLIDDLNLAIEQSEALSTLYDGPKLEAFIVPTTGEIGFRLNANVFPDDNSYTSENWSIEVFSEYNEPSPNGAFTELNISERTVDVALKGVPLTALTDDLAGTDPYTLTTDAVLNISINGSDFVSVTIPSGASGASFADLISDVNTAFASSNVSIGASTEPLSSFIRAAMSRNGRQMEIITQDLSGDPVLSEVITMRVFADPNVVNNSAVDQLGFGVTEQRAGWRGGEAYLDRIKLTGTATVTDQPLTATGNFGFAEFSADDGELDLQAKMSTQFGSTTTRFSLYDLNDLVSSGTIETVAVSNVDPTTFVHLELRDLNFTGDAVAGLDFASDATITIEHVLTSSGSGTTGFLSRISEFGDLPVPHMTYYHTAGLETLSGLAFQDIFQGLIRTGEFITDQMSIDPDGSGAAVNAYATKLLFVKEGLVDIFDFGYEFEQSIAQMVDSPPESLQDLRAVIASALQVETTDVDVSLVTDYVPGGDILDSSSLRNATIEISLPFVRTFAVALPLFIDLAQLRNRSSDPDIVKDYLAGLDALASSVSNPMDVDLNILAELDLSLGVEVVNNFETNRPRAVLYDTTTIDTDFNLAGSGFVGDLPVGNARFRLTDGQVAINQSGETEVNDLNNTERLYNELALTPDFVPPAMLQVEAATTADLRGVYDGVAGTLTANANGRLTVDGVSVSVGDLVLVNNQEDDSYSVPDGAWNVVEADLAQNGVYRVVKAGNPGQQWELERDSSADSATEINGLYVTVANGNTYGGRDFLQTAQTVTVGTDSVSFAKLIDPAEFSIDLNGDFVLPYAVRVATTGSLDGIYASGPTPSSPSVGSTLTSRINQNLNNVQSLLSNGRTVSGIDGVTELAEGDLILLKDQLTDAVAGTNTQYQNGIYRIVDIGEGGTSGRSWVLERVDFADEVNDLVDLRVSVQQGRDNGRVAFIQNSNTLAAISAGETISFTSDLATVYSSFNRTSLQYEASADINPNGQAQAYLPMVIVVTDENGIEKIITKDTSQLTDAQAADPVFMATQPHFDPVNIRVVSYAGRSGLDRMFDLNVPSNVPGVPAPVVFFSNPDLPADELPPLGRNIPPVDVLQVLRDPFLMGEALDLALFNLQFAIDQALGNQLPLLGLDLPSHTLFIENWRSAFTNQLRDELRNNKLKPINAVLDSLAQALGPGGVGLISGRNDITVETLDASESATVWDPSLASNYDFTPLNEEFEKSPAGAVSLQFSLDLVKQMDTSATETNIDRIYMPNELGMEIDTRTQALDANFNTVDTNGGVNLRTSFTLHLGFGVDLVDGFYLYNPIDDGTGAPEAVMEIGVEAVLDGNLAQEGVQVFNQGERHSQLNLLTVSIGDAMSVSGGSLATDAEPGAKGASGFYGNYEFYLNSGSGGNENQRTTITDMQIRNTLGVDPGNPLLTGSLSDIELGVLSFATHGDVDIHLLVEGGKDGSSFGSGGGIPDIQTEFYFQARFGDGSDRLSYVSQLVYDDAVAAVNSGTATAEQAAIADQPDFRVLRELIDGAVYDYTNITVDAEGFLKGTIFEMLIKFSEGMAPIRPVIDFLLAPVPGTSWMDEPFVLGDLLGPKFVAFAKTLTRLDDMIRALGEGISGAPNKPHWARPRVSLASDTFLGTQSQKLVGGTLRSVGVSTTYGQKTVLTQERERIQKYVINRRVDAYQRELDRNNPAKKALQSITNDRSAALRMRDAFNEKVTTPNKFSQRFEKFRDKGFAEKQSSSGGNKYVNKVRNAVRSSANEGLAGTDDRGGRTQATYGVSGGGFRLDYLKVETIQKILIGETANLSYLELPRLEVGLAFSRSFPLPAFPPLVATVGISVSVNAHLKFGWDTEGFYWSTLDTQGNKSPAFGVSATFTVGVALNFGLIEAGIQAFFTLDLDFNWNDITVPTSKDSSTLFGTNTDRSDPTAVGYGKLRGSQIDFLRNMPGADAKMGNLFDVTLTGTIGLTFYVDLTIPVPFVGPITKRILSKTFSMVLFQVTFYAEKPGIQLGSQNGGTLTLHMGDQFANLRLFGDTTPRNEVFTLERVGSGTSSGDKVRIHATLNGQDFASDVFDNITHVIGYAGGGQSVIDASALLQATVDFTGGSGNSMLFGSAAAGGVLRGGTGTSTLRGASTQSNTLIGGQGNTRIYGGTAADTIHSGLRSDILDGGGGGDHYVFVDNFGRDRLFVTGRGNTADFAGVESDLTFNLGRLVQSAKTGVNTIFFAPDSSGLNSIDTWLAGSGDDRFNTFYFEPNNTVNLNGGAGSNFYSITLGNQSKRYFADIDPTASTLLGRMDPRNIGTIDITDPTDNGHVLIKQTFPERIRYDRYSISNGREQATMSGIKVVDLDAGNATVVWGEPGVEWIDLGVGSTVTAGTIEMRSNVEAEGLNLFLKRSFSVTQVLSLRNNSDLNLQIQNPDPLATANLFLGPGPGGIGVATPGIYSSSGSVFVAGVGSGAPDGNGSGLIKIHTPTGSVLNGAFGPGVIQALQGEVVIEARDSVGYDIDPVTINAKYFAAKTTKALSTLSEGINVRSDGDLHVAYVDGIDGVNTISGRIELSVDSGSKLFYGNVSAGDGRDIIFNADEIAVSPGRDYITTEIQAITTFVPQTVTIYVPITRTTYLPHWFGWFLRHYHPYTYTVWEARNFTIHVPVTTYAPVQVTKTVPAGGSIKSSGNVYFRNVSSDLAVRIGGIAPITNTLNITKDVLDSISTSAQSIVVGRTEEDSILTGAVGIENYHFDKALVAQGSQIDILGTGSTADLTSTAKIEVTAYEGAGNGNIHFQTSAAPIIAPTLLASAFRNIQVDTTLQSGAANGLIQLKAGQGASGNGAANNTGTITLASTGSILTTDTGGNIILEAGLSDGDVILDGPISSANNLSIHALGGSVTQAAGSELTAIRLEVLARDETNLRTNVDIITHAELSGSGSLSGENLTIIERDDVIIDLAKTDAGDLFLTTGDTLHFGQIDVTRGFDITIDSGKAITSDDVSPDANVRARNVTITAGGGVEFVSDVDDLNIVTSDTGDVAINNQGGLGVPLNLTQIITHDGSIQIDTESDLKAVKVVSQTSDPSNSITLRTRELFGGNIILDDVNAGANGNVFVQSGGLNIGGPLSSGGTITSDPATTNRIVANELTAIAGGWAAYPGPEVINLRTDVTDLIARARSGGDPTQTDSMGSITIDEANDIRLRWIDTVSGDISVVAGGDIVHQAVRSPNSDIFLQAGGSITAQLDDALSDGVAPLPAKLLGDNLVVRANDEIIINTTVASMDIASLVSGSITITESDSALFTSLTTQIGDIDVTVGEFNNTTQLITKGGNAVFGTVRAGAAGDHNVDLTVYGQARSSGEVDAGGNLLPGDPSLVGAKIHAAILDASAYGRLDLVTNIDRLTGETFEIGNIEFLEDDELAIDHLVSHSGSIQVTAGNTISALYIESSDDIDQPATFDVNLQATSGDVLIDQINAGGGFNDIIILADLGAIEEVNPEDLDDSHEGNSPGGIDLIGDHLSLTAAGSIGSVRDLETAANSIEAHSTVLGDIEIDEQDSVDLTDIDTRNGTIHLDAGGTITVTDVESLTDLDRNDITLHNTQGDILIGKLNAGTTEGDVFLTSDNGGIDEVFPEDRGVDLTADHALVSASSSFGGKRAIETELNTVIAEVHNPGGIGLNERTTITLVSLIAADGRIDVTARADIYALDVVTNTDTRGNSMSFDAGGTLWIDRIIAGASSNSPGVPASEANIVMTASIINELGSDPAIDLRAAFLSMEARRGNVGSLVNPLETTASKIRSVSNIGDNSIQNFSNAPVFVSEYFTRNGTMLFEQFGSTITFRQVRNNDGDTSIIHHGGGNMQLKHVNLRDGDLFLNVNEGGRLKLFNAYINGDSFFQADEMDFPGPYDGVRGTGILEILHDNPLRGTFVNPYYGEADLALLLEVDVYSLARLEFDGIFFLENVIFLSPITSFFANVGSGDATNLSDPASNTNPAPFTALWERKNETEWSATMNELSGLLPFSLYGLAGFGINDPASTWLHGIDDYEGLFRDFFGYDSIGLEGLTPDLFDQLIEQLQKLEEELENEEFNEGEVALRAELSDKALY